MLPILKKTTAPLLSLFVFILGSGFFTTLLAVRLHDGHAKPFAIGALTAAYYFGLMLGSFRMERFILRVGHIRAFAALSSSLAVICILHGIYVETWFWIILRLIGGFATAGIFIVIESWLLVLGTIQTRGQILSLYMITFYAAQATGQFFLNLASPKELILYAIAGMTASLAVLPLSMTRSQSPQIDEPSSLNPIKLYQASPAGVFGSVCAGLILSAIYGLVPVYFAQLSHNKSDISFYMALIIFGGMLLQYPIGKISDFTDRRTVLIVVSILTAIVATGMLLTTQIHWALIPLTFIFGGLAFTIYPISISHVCDVLDSKDILAATQGLVLTYSIGACLGPIIAPIFMHFIPSGGLFIFFVVICGLLTAFLLMRKVRQAAVPQTEQEQFVTIPQTTAVIAELDPRSEEGAV